MILSRYLVEPILRGFDSEEHELVLRWRLWKMRWFPYRTIEWLGYDEKNDEFIWGEKEWNPPDRWQERRRRRGGD